QRTDMPGLSWKLERIERHYQWYRRNDYWNYEPITVTTKIADGTIDASAMSEPRISVPVDWGRYRLEVASAEPDGPATSVEFNAGWFVEATSTETPDGLEIALDKEGYAAGETARLNVSPRFAGQLLVTIGADRLYETLTAEVPAEGATIDIPVRTEWGAGNAHAYARDRHPRAEDPNRQPSSFGLGRGAAEVITASGGRLAGFGAGCGRPRGLRDGGRCRCRHHQTDPLRSARPGRLVL